MRSPHALYQIKPLSCDPARLKGLSEKLIVSHYENNYGGAVKRLNAITEQLAALDFARAPVFTINGFKREELIATNSMILHELYFDGLGESRGSAGRAQRRPYARFWGHRALASGVQCHGQGAGRGFRLGAAGVFGARQQARQPVGRRSYPCHLARGVPILALDMYEHSYHIDYGAKAAAYVDAFMQNINWANVIRLYRECLS